MYGSITESINTSFNQYNIIYLASPVTSTLKTPKPPKNEEKTLQELLNCPDWEKKGLVGLEEDMKHSLTSSSQSVTKVGPELLGQLKN